LFFERGARTDQTSSRCHEVKPGQRPPIREPLWRAHRSARFSGRKAAVGQGSRPTHHAKNVEAARRTPRGNVRIENGPGPSRASPGPRSAGPEDGGQRSLIHVTSARHSRATANAPVGRFCGCFPRWWLAVAAADCGWSRGWPRNEQPRQRIRTSAGRAQPHRLDGARIAKGAYCEQANARDHWGEQTAHPDGPHYRRFSCMRFVWPNFGTAPALPPQAGGRR
jgi:hypothetical protein